MSEALKQWRPAGEADTSAFSLYSGGPLYQMARRSGLISGESSLSHLGIAIGLATWIPLLVLTLIQQFSTGGGAKAFGLSIGTHVRLLMAIPLFFAVESWSGPRLRSFIGNLVETKIVPPDGVSALRAAQDSAVRLRDTWVAEAMILFFTLVILFSGGRIDASGAVSAWRMSGSEYTPAGWWYAAIAMPVFQFLFWRWSWRIVIWTLFLRRVSRLDLQLIPTHPDLCGGLGYAAVVQTYISAVGIAFSLVLAGSTAEMILVGAISPPELLPLILEVTGINLLIFLGPLLFFTMRMLEVKRRGYREYGVLAANYTRKFDEKWVHGTRAPDEQLLGTGDIQSLADLGNGFNFVRNMRLLPFGVGIVANVIAFSVVPILPLFFFRFSVNEIIMKLGRLLLGM